MYVMESFGGFTGQIKRLSLMWTVTPHYATAQGHPTCLGSLCVSAFLIKDHNRSSWQTGGTGRQPEKPPFTFLLDSRFALPSLRSRLYKNRMYLSSFILSLPLLTSHFLPFSCSGAFCWTAEVGSERSPLMRCCTRAIRGHCTRKNAPPTVHKHGCHNSDTPVA